MPEKTPKERVDDYRERSIASSAGMSEAPGIAFCTIYMDGLPINLTARSMTPYDAIASLKISIKMAEEFLGVTRERDLPKAAAPVKKDPVDEAFPKEPVYEDFRDGEVTFATSIKILPQPNDKVTLEFYEEGKQYPVIKVNKWKIENAQELIAKVTSQDVSKAAEVQVNCNVFWTQGNEWNINGKTGHYKNVSDVQPA